MLTQVDFWKAPSHLFKPVDIEVSEGDLGAFCNILKEHGITFDVHIDDVQQLLDRALAPVGARSVSGWHSIYHNLTEVCSRIIHCYKYDFTEPEYEFGYVFLLGV